MRLTARLMVALLLACLGADHARGLDEPAPDDPARARARDLFRKTVRPVLEAKCFACHGEGEELEGELDLTTREAMIRGGKGGPALVPGDPLASPIYQAMRRTDERMMPPKERDGLLPREVDAFKAWIDAGAPWPTR